MEALPLAILEIMRQAESNIFSGISLDWKIDNILFSYENKFNYNNSTINFLAETRIGYAHT